MKLIENLSSSDHIFTSIVAYKECAGSIDRLYTSKASIHHYGLKPERFKIQIICFLAMSIAYLSINAEINRGLAEPKA
jgi:hypothetical protein